ncbi:MAG: hypothetical protein LBS27_09245 [Bifidobacteriaceae bacterium]|jgi:ABC-type cobalamin transport system permease subunit|nr:hypothetical protein [Bifidobacteriaceae bacterium]
MGKTTLDSLAAGLKGQQAAAAKAVAQLKAELSPEALVALGKEKAADAARSAALEPSGRPKPWVLILVSVIWALLVGGIVLRIARRRK